MCVECRIAWGCEEIAAGVTAHNVVNSTVGTDLNVWNAFRKEAVLGDVGLLEEVYHVD